MSGSKEQQLWDACTSENLELVKHFAKDPAIDVNWADPKDNRTALYIACLHGHLFAVELLLKSPNIDVNKAQKEGATPFHIACAQGHKEVVLSLLKDRRLNMNLSNHNQLSPLWCASQEGHLSVIECLLASGREVDTKTKSIAGPAAWNNKTAVEIARAQGTRTKSADETEEEYARSKQNGSLIAVLLDSFEENPQQVRARLREQLDFSGRIFCFFYFFFFFFFVLFR